MARTHPAPPAPSPGWKRYLLVGTVLVVVVATAILVFWPSIQVSLWLGQLHSDDPAVRREARNGLAASEKSGLNETLYEALTDPDRVLSVRTQVGDILIARNRLNLVEKALRSDDLAARLAALVVLHNRWRGEALFRKNYLESPAYRVRETLGAWLDRDGDLTRADAVEIIRELDLEDLAPKLRGLVGLPREGMLVPAEAALISSASRALVQFGQCDAVPDILASLQETGDPRLQFGLLDVVFDAIVGNPPPCPGAVPEDAVRASLVAALDGPPGASHADVMLLRQKALLLFPRKPEWLEAVADKVQAILDDAADNTEAVRRAALSALASTKGDAFAAKLPRYFHAPNQYIRSEAVSAARVYSSTPQDPHRFEACWIGILRDETQNRVAFASALQSLRASARRWEGLPAGVERKLRDRGAYDAFVAELFERGESQGVDRISWADTWFGWWAKELGLADDAVAQAVATRNAFWEAAAKGDAAGAKQALEAFGERPKGLFCYEEGWLEAHAPTA